MKPMLDQHMFTQIGLDSGALTILGAVVHNFPERGAYRGVVLRNDRIETTFYLMVDENSPASQVHIDLARLNDLPSKACCTSDHPEPGPHFVVNPKGYAVFYVSSGAGGYAVHVGTIDAGPKPKSFDSRELREGDLFSATLLRPGKYVVTNVKTESKLEIEVAYPRMGKTAYSPPDPIKIECTSDGIRAEHTKLRPAQGQLYHFKTPSRIIIDLVEPNDGPVRPREKSVGQTRRFPRIA